MLGLVLLLDELAAVLVKSHSSSCIQLESLLCKSYIRQLATSRCHVCILNILSQSSITGMFITNRQWQQKSCGAAVSCKAW